MPFDSDVALLGTGLATLVAANHLLIQGKSVLLLNPDLDFYLEDSELPLDPLLQGPIHPRRLLKSSPKNALSVLRPEFPGAVEFWSPQSDPSGFHDPLAPHIHQRGRLWISSYGKSSPSEWETLEDLYVEASDADLNPQILDGISAVKKLPGFSGSSSLSGNFRGLYLPKLCDIDIVRYRNGLLEYVRERLGPERMICSANSVEWMPEGIRFHCNGSLRTAKLREGLLVFWTPRLNSWILNQAKRTEVVPKLPKGIRVWEQWSLNSREPIDLNTVGIFKNMAIWADFEGLPQSQGIDRKLFNLSILRAGPLVPFSGAQPHQGNLSWASAESFGSLSDLCHDFLKWDRFSIRSMKPRAVFEWDHEESWSLSKADPLVQVIPACDGPLIDVVRMARLACDRLPSAASPGGLE